jgi:hypothetical protein
MDLAKLNVFVASKFEPSIGLGLTRKNVCG